MIVVLIISNLFLVISIVFFAMVIQEVIKEKKQQKKTTTKIKTIEKAKKLGLRTFLYDSGDWEYKDTEGYYHLFKDGEELLPEIKKKVVILYDDGDWTYKDTNNKWYTLKGENNE